MVPSFKDRLQAVNPKFETFTGLQTLQINLGNLCNLHCQHCHVNASRRGTEIMGIEVIKQITTFLSRHPPLTLDITGGCPEMNPNFRTLIEKTDGLTPHRMLRSNLAIMAEPGWEWLPEYCRQHELTVIGSLPCYLEENVDGQRGQGVYQKCIQVLKRLNALGYGQEVELNLVYNPGGDFIPGRQHDLETAYKRELLLRHGIIFNHLFTLTNAPIGRFREHLEATGTYREYLQLLASRFNPAAAGNIMCRTLISVDWQGKLYNCDFNQALGMAITAADGSEIYLSSLDASGINGQKISLSEHCYCCTAGEGSSCTGSLLP
ncbi:MAG: arsenosugar biosynthesis radical SAM (seleno)protein ArsS [Desulfuromonadales bacterium]|nr:arsenosugar biosynthesis radical SAM (seleno)protein ArsS [Desulfuromonadales bacterium]